MTNNARENFNHEPASATATCPIDYYLFPVRYALSEPIPGSDQNQELIVEHPSFNPTTTRTRLQTLRRLRAGFLYVYQQGSGLKKYIVNQNGELKLENSGSFSKGIKVACAPVWLLYSEIAISDEAYSELADVNNAQQRQIHMRLINLSQANPDHCFNLADAPNVMAELKGFETRKPALRPGSIEANSFMTLFQCETNMLLEVKKLDLISQGNDEQTIQNVLRSIRTHRNNEFITRFTATTPQQDERPSRNIYGKWSAESWNINQVNLWFRGVREENGSQGKLVGLEDPMGMLRDINNYQAIVNTEDNEWQNRNAHKSILANFINDLITPNVQELTILLNSKFAVNFDDNKTDRILTFITYIDGLWSKRNSLTNTNQLQRRNREVIDRIDNLCEHWQESLAEVIPDESLRRGIQQEVLSYLRSKEANESPRSPTEYYTSVRVREYVYLDKVTRFFDEENNVLFAFYQKNRAFIHDRNLYIDMLTPLVSLYYSEANRDSITSDKVIKLNDFFVMSFSEQCSSELGIEQVVTKYQSEGFNIFKLFISNWIKKLANAMQDGILTSDLKAALIALDNHSNQDVIRSYISDEGFDRFAEIASAENSLWVEGVIFLAPFLVEISKQSRVTVITPLIFATYIGGVDYHFTGLSENSFSWKTHHTAMVDLLNRVGTVAISETKNDFQALLVAAEKIVGVLKLFPIISLYSAIKPLAESVSSLGSGEETSLTSIGVALLKVVNTIIENLNSNYINNNTINTKINSGTTNNLINNPRARTNNTTINAKTDNTTTNNTTTNNTTTNNTTTNNTTTNNTTTNNTKGKVRFSTKTGISLVVSVISIAKVANSLIDLEKIERKDRFTQHRINAVKIKLGIDALKLGSKIFKLLTNSGTPSSRVSLLLKRVNLLASLALIVYETWALIKEGSPLQRFLNTCYFGKQPLYGSSPDENERINEIADLMKVLYTPRLDVRNTSFIEHWTRWVNDLLPPNIFDPIQRLIEDEMNDYHNNKESWRIKISLPGATYPDEGSEVSRLIAQYILEITDQPININHPQTIFGVKVVAKYLSQHEDMTRWWKQAVLIQQIPNNEGYGLQFTNTVTVSAAYFRGFAIQIFYKNPIANLSTNDRYEFIGGVDGICYLTDRAGNIEEKKDPSLDRFNLQEI